MNTLKSQIARLIGSNGDSNQTALTLSPEYGWSVSWSNNDRENDAICIISKDGLNEWAHGFEWTDEQFESAAEYVQANLIEWLRDTDITRSDILAHI